LRVYCAGWWFKPDFIINELNINSAITTPAHDEAVPYAEKTVVKGYAYAGAPTPFSQAQGEILLHRSALSIANLSSTKTRSHRLGGGSCRRYWYWPFLSESCALLLR